jgi:hypothetical protein
MGGRLTKVGATALADEFAATDGDHIIAFSKYNEIDRLWRKPGLGKRGINGSDS